MNIFAKFKRNEDATNNGKLLVLGYAADGSPIGILVARIHESNKRYDNTIANIKKSRQQELDRIRKIDEQQFQDVIKEIANEAICDTCILGFVGLTDADGNKLEYNAANVKRICVELPELFDKICDFGIDSTNYVGEFDEVESAKN